MSQKPQSLRQHAHRWEAWVGERSIPAGFTVASKDHQVDPKEIQECGAPWRVNKAHLGGTDVCSAALERRDIFFDLDSIQVLWTVRLNWVRLERLNARFCARAWVWFFVITFNTQLTWGSKTERFNFALFFSILWIHSSNNTSWWQRSDRNKSKSQPKLSLLVTSPFAHIAVRNSRTKQIYSILLKFYLKHKKCLGLLPLPGLEWINSSS